MVVFNQWAVELDFVTAIVFSSADCCISLLKNVQQNLGKLWILVEVYQVWQFVVQFQRSSGFLNNNVEKEFNNLLHSPDLRKE